MSHYFDPAPAAPSRPGRIAMRLPGFEVELQVDRGVFAAGGVDAGTMELLRSGAGPGAGDPPVAGGQLLDLGCGYGPIAMALAHRFPAATVWAVDINRRALQLTTANATELGVADRVRAVPPEAVPPGLTFAGIWSNPPIRVGKPALHSMLQEWLGRLAPGAAAWLVVQKHLGADSLAAWLGTEGWTVGRIGSRKGYRLLRVAGPGPVEEPA